jgi:hypothetical protein
MCHFLAHFVQTHLNWSYKIASSEGNSFHLKFSRTQIHSVFVSFFSLFFEIEAPNTYITEKMYRLVEIAQIIAAISLIACAISSVAAQDYDGETETAITGLNGLTGLSGLGGLTALANGIVTGYAPIGASSEVDSGPESGSDGGSDGVYQGGSGDRNLGASESSDAESGDYDEDSNDSSASEEHPILSKFFNLISGGRHKRSVDSLEPSESHKAHSRVKRGYKGWVPYVSTYVKTDKKANFKWGVSMRGGDNVLPVQL